MTDDERTILDDAQDQLRNYHQGRTVNELQNDIRRSVGYTAAPTVRRIIEKRGALMTEGQIETAGKAYVKATVSTMAADLVLDGVRLVGRTLWMLATYAAIIGAGIWTYQHWGAILRWLK